ncbi:MAG: transcription termination/antitermination protein NusG [Candidatus Firestonebacteria bacterium]
MEKKWYFISTYSGCEDKVKKNLEERIKTLGMENSVFEVMVPKEDVVQIKKGKKTTVKKNFYPGYVLVQMDMNDETWQVVRNTPKVTGFVRSGPKPVPLADSEAERIFAQAKGDIPTPKHVVEFERGDAVRVIEGPFSNFSGVIEEVFAERMKAKVMVTVFSRPTLAEIDFTNIEKI